MSNELMARWASVSPTAGRPRDLARALVADERMRRRLPSGAEESYTLETMAVYVHRLARGQYRWWQQDEARADALAAALKLPRHRLPFAFAPTSGSIVHAELPSLRAFDPRGRTAPFNWFDLGPRDEGGRGKDPFQFGQLAAGDWVVMPRGTGMRFLYQYHRVRGLPVSWVKSLDDLRDEGGRLLARVGRGEIELSEPGWVFVDGPHENDPSWLRARRITVLARREPGLGWEAQGRADAVLTVRPRPGWRRQYLVDWVSRRFRNPRSPDFDATAIADALDRVDPQERLVATPGDVLRFASQREHGLPAAWEEALMPLVMLAGGPEMTAELSEALVQIASMLLARTAELYAPWDLDSVGLDEVLAARLVLGGALVFEDDGRYRLARSAVTTGALLDALRRRIAGGDAWHEAALVSDRRDLVELFLRCCSPTVFQAAVADVLRGDARVPEDLAAALVCFRALVARADELEWMPVFEVLASWLYAGTPDESYPHKWFWVPEQQIAATWKVAGRLTHAELPCWLFPRERTRGARAPDWLADALDRVIPGDAPNPAVPHPPPPVAEFLQVLPELASYLPESPRALGVLKLVEALVTGAVTADTIAGWDLDAELRPTRLSLMRLVAMPQTQAWLQSQRPRWAPTTATTLVQLLFGWELARGHRIDHLNDCFRALPSLVLSLLPEVPEETWPLLLAGRVVDRLDAVPAALHAVVLRWSRLAAPSASAVLRAVDSALALEHLGQVHNHTQIDELWARYPTEVLAKLRETPAVHVLVQCPAAHADAALDIVADHGLGRDASRWLRAMLTSPGVNHARVFQMLTDLGEI